MRCFACRDGACEDCATLGLYCECCGNRATAQDIADDRAEHDARDRGEGR